MRERGDGTGEADPAGCAGDAARKGQAEAGAWQRGRRRRGPGREERCDLVLLPVTCGGGDAGGESAALEHTYVGARPAGGNQLLRHDHWTLGLTLEGEAHLGWAWGPWLLEEQVRRASSAQDC